MNAKAALKNPLYMLWTAPLPKFIETSIKELGSVALWHPTGRWWGRFCESCSFDNAHTTKLDQSQVGTTHDELGRGPCPCPRPHPRSRRRDLDLDLAFVLVQVLLGELPGIEARD